MYVCMYVCMYVLQEVTVCTTSNRGCGAIRCCRFVVVVAVVDIVFIYRFYLQLLVSLANHSATETSIKKMFNKPMIYVVTRNKAVHP